MSRSFYRVYGEAREKDARLGLWPSRWNLSGYGLWLGLWAMQSPLGEKEWGEEVDSRQFEVEGGRSRKGTPPGVLRKSAETVDGKGVVGTLFWKSAEECEKEGLNFSSFLEKSEKSVIGPLRIGRGRHDLPG
jgi:hypothetical protein